jgi:multiple sugar transport system substrate-binding protein
MDHRTNHSVSRRQFLTYSAGVGALATLAACGAQAPAPAQQAPAAAPAAGETKAPEQPAAAPVELRFILLSQIDPVMAYFNETAIPTFQEANPGVTVKVDMSDWNHLGEKMLTSFAGNIPIDLVMTGSDWVGPYAARKQFMVLDDFAASYPELSDFYPRMVDISRYNSKLMALPYILDIRTMCYRKDHFKDAGFDPEKPPQNWDDLVTYATKLVQADAQGNITRAGYEMNASAPNNAFFEWWYLLIQNGTNVVVPWGSWDTKDVVFNNDAGVEALQFLYDLVHKYKVSPITGVSTKVPDLSTLGEGVASMSMQGSWEIGNWKRNQPDKIDLLGIGVPLEKVKRLTYCCPNVYAMGTNTQNPDKAWELMKHMVSEETITGMLGPESNSPPRMAVAKNAAYMKDPMLVLFQEIPVKGWGDTTPQATEFPTLEIIGNYVQAVLRDEIGVKEALDKSTEEVKKKIDELNQAVGA